MLIKIALILDDEEEEQAKRHQKRKRRFWVHKMLKKRNEEGEFVTLHRELTDDKTKFFKYYRMSIEEFQNLLGKIEEVLQKQNTTFRESISPIQKLAVCLRFLATGDSYQTIAFSYRLGHSTVHAIVQEVCDAIIHKLLSVYIPIPCKKNWKNISSRFWTAWNFPNCLGALDGKHIEIVAPANSGSTYFNYKKTFSVVLLALIDADYKFIAVDVGSYGKNSDGGIFANSRLGRQLENDSLDIPDSKQLPDSDIVAPYVILGDSAFPLKTNLLRPFPQAQILNDVKKRIFNYRHCRARRVVENGFGILAQRFRIYFRKIYSKPGYIEKIILTTCILHNYLSNKNVRQEENIPMEDHNESILRHLPKHGGNAQQEAFNSREKFTMFFNSDSGSVPWQYEKI